MPGIVPTLFKFAPTLVERAEAHDGLRYAYYGGNVLTSSGYVNVPEGSVELADEDVNFVECSNSGVVSANNLGFTPGAMAMAKVSTTQGTLLRITSRRLEDLITETTRVDGHTPAFEDLRSQVGPDVTRFTLSRAFIPGSVVLLRNGMPLVHNQGIQEILPNQVQLEPDVFGRLFTPRPDQGLSVSYFY